MDLYKILGVSKKANDKDIKKAYRKLAMKYHPDVNPGGEDKFKEVNQAYEILGDPEKRKVYDEVGAQAIGSGFSAEFFRQYQQHKKDEQLLSGGLTEILSKLFSKESDDLWDRINAFHARRSYQATTISILLSFEDMINGKQLDIKNGSNILHVAIPPGIKDGQKIKIKDPKSDQFLFLFIKVKPHPVFSRKNDDIYMKVKLSPRQALTGGLLPIVTPAGATEVKIPPNVKDGQKLRLKKMGVQRPKHEPGNLYLQLLIED